MEMLSTIAKTGSEEFIRQGPDVFSLRFSMYELKQIADSYHRSLRRSGPDSRSDRTRAMYELAKLYVAAKAAVLERDLAMSVRLWASAFAQLSKFTDNKTLKYHLPLRRHRVHWSKCAYDGLSMKANAADDENYRKLTQITGPAQKRRFCKAFLAGLRSIYELKEHGLLLGRDQRNFKVFIDTWQHIHDSIELPRKRPCKTRKA